MTQSSSRRWKTFRKEIFFRVTRINHLLTSHLSPNKWDFNAFKASLFIINSSFASPNSRSFKDKKWSPRLCAPWWRMVPFECVCPKREEGTGEIRDHYKQCKQGTLQCISKISRVHMCVTVGILTWKCPWAQFKPFKSYFIITNNLPIKVCTCTS